MKKDRFKDDLFVFVIAFFVLFVIYAAIFNDNTTSDHVGAYSILLPRANFPKLSIEVLLNRMLGGRFSCLFTDYIWWFMGLFGCNQLENQIPMKVLMLICLALSVTIMVCIFERYSSSRYSKEIITFLSLVSFINPYFIEIWKYVGIEWTVGILSACIATYFFVNKKYFWSSFFVLLSIGFYQSFIENFLIMATMYVFLDHRKKLDLNALISYGKMFLVAGIPAVINIAGQKVAALIIKYFDKKNVTIVSDSKFVSLRFDIFSRLYHKVFGHYWYISVKGFGYFPFGFLFFITVIIFLILFFYQYHTLGIRAVIHFSISFILINFFSVAIFLVSGYSLEARLAWNYFIAFSMMFICMHVILDEANPKWLCLVPNFLFGVFAIVNIYVTNTKVTDIYIAQKADEQLIDDVEAEIEYYEKTTGIKVTEVAARKSPNFDYQSSYINLSSATSAYDRRLMANEWADVEALNYFTGNNYSKFYMTDEEYEQFFGDKYWDAFLASEQMVFVGNKLYWAIY